MKDLLNVKERNSYWLVYRSLYTNITNKYHQYEHDYDYDAYYTDKLAES